MSRDMLAALIDAAYTKRADDADKYPRRPDGNNPMRPIAQRPERKTKPQYRDRTGSQATGRARREDPDGTTARARALRRARLEGGK